jgi:hypothetical protein
VTEGDVEAIIAAQAALIAALDAGDVAAVEATTATLSRLLAAARSGGAAVAVRRDRIDHALKQATAARTRVNYLADRTRARLDRLSAAHGGRPATTYNATGRMAISGR